MEKRRRLLNAAGMQPALELQARLQADPAAAAVLLRNLSTGMSR